MQNQSQENYLRAIYKLSKNNKKSIQAIDIAKYLKISKAGVSQMLKKLASSKLIEYTKDSKIILSQKGFKQASVITYKHRIIERFLCDNLKISPSTAHKEAHDLEHAFSLNTTKKLYNYLNNPKTCPHNHRIPKI